MITTAQLVQAYGEMVGDRVAEGWTPYLLTFMFDEIAGLLSNRQSVMRHEVERIYATLLPRVVRHPRSLWHAWKCPILIGGPDWPVPKHDRSDKRMFIPNDGCHVHGLMLLPPVCRLKVPLEQHVEENRLLYVRWPLIQCDVKPITYDARYVLEYVLKSLLRARATPDDLIILPRALSELTVAARREG